jgi:type IV fimbrial biogenesis protein FimT
MLGKSIPIYLCLHKRHEGFTLLEMMVAISVLAILVTLAIPSFSEAILSSKLKSYSSYMVSSIYLARGEALKRNTTINLCVSGDGLKCTAGNWENGWIVLSRDQVIHRQQALGKGYKVIELSDQTDLRFQSSGLLSQTATFTICRTEPTPGSHGRSVSLSITAKPFVAKTTREVCV